MKLFITYGVGSNLGRNYSVVEGADYDACREHVFLITEGRFGFTYTEEQFAGQVEKWGMTEVPLQPQVFHGEE